MRSGPLLLLLLLARLSGSVFANDNIAAVRDADVPMNQAIQKARDSLGAFIQIKANPKSGAEHFELKVSFARELMWVSPFRVSGSDGHGKGDSYEGILKSVPQYNPTLAWGKQVSFSRDQIVDWGYTKDGRRHGHFTTCVLLARMKPDEATKIRKDMRLECVP
nr:DUF2314 domain-containing protein [uncultured Roseateles sp.]